MRNFNSAMAEDNYDTSQSNLNAEQVHQRQIDEQQQRQRPIRTDSLQELNDELAANAAAGGRQPSAGRTTRIADEMSQDLQFLSRDAPLDGGESTFGAYSTLGGSNQPSVGANKTTTTQHHTLASTITRTTSHGENLENDYERTDFRIDDTDDQQVGTYNQQTRARQQLSEPPTYTLEQLAPDNVDIQRPLQQAGPLPADLLTEFSGDESDHRQDLAIENGAGNYEDEGGQGLQASCDEPIVVDAAVATDASLVNTDVGRPRLGDQLSPAVSSRPPLKPFLVSFMVDARGGAMRGCRHSGVRVIIPPNTAQQPMRITCRYLRRERLVHPPPLMEGEACASKIMEVGPAGAKFLGPVLIEVPHFASLRGKEREIIILRSDSGEVWREHLVEADDDLVESIIRSAELVENNNYGDQHQQQQENTRPASATGASDDMFNRSGGDSQQQQQEKRLTRIVTNEFPQYFAIISRIRQEVHSVGPDGSVVDSQVVPKVQAIFTEGALTKRIKIGLQKRNTSPDESPQLQAKELHQHEADETRAQSPSSTGTDAGGRPGSAAKRRSRFLACFGSGNGSHDLLDQSGTDGEFASGSAEDSSLSAAGGDSPRQPVNEKLVERRHIIEDVSDSEQDSLKLSPRLRKKRASNLVPEDYYIEKESPLILNVEPTTYGKRLASSSAQTDHKLTANGFLSTSTKSKKRRGVSLLGGGKRRHNKTQMTIPLHEPTYSQIKQQQGKQKSTSMTQTDAPADSSLESQGLDFDLLEHKSPDLSTSKFSTGLVDSPEANSKWLTRTIQTDSDSVTVQYVTIYGNDTAAATSATATGQDDGYVSGSGDLKKDHQHKSTITSSKGIFSPFCVSSKAEVDDQLSIADAELKLNEAGQLDVATDAKKARGKKSANKKSVSKLAPSEQERQKLDIVLETKTLEPVDQQPRSLSGTSSPAVANTTTTTEFKTVGDEARASAEVQSGGEDADESLITTATTTRSISPTSKESKAKLKLEKAEKAKKEKLEKQRQKELDEANAKAEKARKKLEKEAKKKAGEEQKASAKKAGTQSPSPDAVHQTVVSTHVTDNQGLSNSTEGDSSDTSAKKSKGFNLSKTIQSVKFAPSPSRSDDGVDKQQAAEGLVSDEARKSPARIDEDSTRASPSKSMINSISSKFKVKRPKTELGGIKQVASGEEQDRVAEVPAAHQEDSMVHVSIGESSSFVEQANKEVPKLGSNAREISIDEDSQGKPISIDSTNGTKPKGILKQASGSLDGPPSAEIVIGEPESLTSMATKLVSEATEDAIRTTEELSRQSKLESPTLTSNQSTESKKELAKKLKAEKSQMKREAKARLEEEKKLIKTAELMAKKAEEAARCAVNEANKVAHEAAEEAKHQAKIAKDEAERAIKEIAEASVKDLPSLTLESDRRLSNSELKRRAKSAEKEAKRLAREANAEAKKKTKEEAKRVAKEAKNELKLDKKMKVSASPPNVTALVPELSEPIDSSTAEDEVTSESRFEQLSIIEISADDKLEQSQETVEIETKHVEVEVPEKVSVSDAETIKDKVTIESEKETDTNGGETSRKSKSTVGKIDIKLPRLNLNFKSKPNKEKGSSKRDEKITASAADGDEKTTTSSEVGESIDKSATQVEQEVEIKTKVKKQKKPKSKGKRVAERTSSGASLSSVSSNLHPTESAPVSEVANKSSFLGRLFRSKPKVPKVDGGISVVASDEVPQLELSASKAATERLERAKRETMIVSEMYPSDPNNADGEMILEVNVPENLINNKSSSKVEDEEQKVTTMITSTTSQPAEPTDDQEATLVNISQMADEEGEDEATENVLSQANDLPEISATADTLSSPDDFSATVGRPQMSQVEPSLTERVDLQLESHAVTPTFSSSKQIANLDENLEEAIREDLAENPVAPVSLELSPKELKSEKIRKELEAKLEKEAKKRAKEEEKLARKRAKNEKKLAEVEAKKRAKEEKAAKKREAKEAKRLAELAKKEAKKTKGEKLKKDVGEQSSPEGQVDEPMSDEQKAEMKPTSTTTAILTSTTTTRGDPSNLAPVDETLGSEQQVDENGLRVLLSSTSEIPVNEEIEVERIVEEVVGEDGTVTKTTKTIETKYTTMRQEELRVSERRDLPADEWERIRAERASPGGTLAKHLDESETTAELYSPELEEIRSVPSFFDHQQLPAEIKPETTPKKAMKKRVKLNQKLIKRALKLARSEAKKAKVSHKRAEAEIAVCDEASRQARRELKRAVKEAKRAAKEAVKQHKKMDKVDKKLAKNAKKIEKSQRKIDKKLAKLEKKAAKKLEKQAKAGASKRGASTNRSPSRSSKKSIKLEDISEPILKSSSRLSIQRQRSNDDNQEFATAILSTSSEAISEVPAQQNQRMSPSTSDLQVGMSLDCNTVGLTRDQIDHGKESDVGTKTATVEGDDPQNTGVRPEAEEATLRLELSAVRDEDDEVVDVVGVDKDSPEPMSHQDSQENQENEAASTPDISETSSAKSGKSKNKRKKNKKSKSKESAN